MNSRQTHPYVLYDTKAARLIHIGLYKDHDDCWGIALGWPTDQEIEEAKQSGIVCVQIICPFDPDKPDE